MTPFFRKVQEDSSGTVNGVGPENQTDHNPNWMLNRDEPPILRRPVGQPHPQGQTGHQAQVYPPSQSQNQGQGYPPQVPLQNQMGTYPGLSMPGPSSSSERLSAQSASQQHQSIQKPAPQQAYHVPPQTIQAGAARASFGEAKVPPSYSNTRPSNDQIRQMGFLQDNFREDTREKGSLDEDDWNDRQSPLNFVILASLIILLTVLGWFTYRWMTTSYTGEPPVIAAEDTPFKIKPENPGGIIVPHQDKLVYGRLAPENQQPVEHLLPQPEQPIAPPQLEQPHYYGNYPSQENGQPGYGSQGYDQSSQQPGGYGAPYQNPQMNQHGMGMAPQASSQPASQPYGGVGNQGAPLGSQGQYSSSGQAPGQPQQPMAYPGYPQQGHPNQLNQPYSPQQQQQYQGQGQVQGVNPGNYGAPNQPYGINQGGYPQGIPSQQGAQGIPNQVSTPTLTPQGAPIPPNQAQGIEQATGEAALAPQSGVILNTMAAPFQEGADDDITEEDKKAQEALDSLVADEIAGKSPPKVNSKDLKASSNKVDASLSGAYRLQVASFETESDAKNEVKRLRALDPSLFKDRKFIIQKSESSSTKKVLYKVMIGFFESANTTNQFKSKLKIHKVEGFVIKSKTETKSER